jgi:hypothetical protein
MHLPAPAVCPVAPDQVVTLNPQHLNSFGTLPRNSLVKQTVSLRSLPALITTEVTNEFQGRS